MIISSIIIYILTLHQKSQGRSCRIIFSRYMDRYIFSKTAYAVRYISPAHFIFIFISRETCQRLTVKIQISQLGRTECHRIFMIISGIILNIISFYTNRSSLRLFVIRNYDLRTFTIGKSRQTTLGINIIYSIFCFILTESGYFRIIIFNTVQTRIINHLNIINIHHIIR